MRDTREGANHPARFFAPSGAKKRAARHLFLERGYNIVLSDFKEAHITPFL